MAGLDPAIHVAPQDKRIVWADHVDARVKPGHDG
jgi:hypothetical protein